MNDELTEQDRLFTEATDLMIRLKNDPDNSIPRDMIRQWRARGPDHERAWAEVAEIHGMVLKVITDDRSGRRRGGADFTRRSLLVAGLVGVGAAASYVMGPRLLLQARADFITGKAEVRRIALSDGSIATLGPESAIAVRLGEDRRFVRLLEGMAFFDVAHDPARAFRVAVSELTATALGTAFEVSDGAGFLSVAVDRGQVEVEAAAPAAGVTKLSTGEWMAFNEEDRTIQSGTRDANQMAAWRTGQLFAENEPVASVIAKISRWQSGRTVVVDPGLGAQRVSGVFDVADPVRALQALVHPFGGRVRTVGSYLTVISPI
jgi:transmembrane sensor